jgi:hypothetical protein
LLKKPGGGAARLAWNNFIRKEMNLALVMGCARSGTSILGELIAAHPEVRYKHEAHAIWDKAGLGENESHRLTQAHATLEVKRLIRKKFAEEQGQAALFAEKCPRSVLRVPFIRAVFPEARLIHLVRDGRDVACSMLPGIGGKEWRHLKPPNWRQLVQEEQGVVRCALAWKTIMEIALHDLAQTPHFMLRYEELVAQPESKARELLEFLELPFAPEVAAFCANIQNETANSYHAQKQVKWFREDHGVRIGRWRENMSPEDAARVEALLRPLLSRFEYVD